MTSISDSSITVTWTRPAITGRDDFFYEILISEVGEESRVVVESSYHNSRGTVDYTISNLDPFTSYNIMVVTHNGVSEQDPENADRRLQEVNGVTAEGGKLILLFACVQACVLACMHACRLV